MSKQKFKSTRNQQVDGEPINKDQVVEVEADRVGYLIARGYLVEYKEAPKKTTTKKTTTKKTTAKDTGPEVTPEQNETEETE